MKVRTKFNLGIVIVFVMLAAVITAATINYVETNTIREAEYRVRTYLRAAREIHDARTAGLQSAAEILAHGQTVRDLLKTPDDEESSMAARDELEAMRQGLEADILSILAPDGTVVLRTRSPYSEGDNVADDPIIRQVMLTQESSAGNTLLEMECLAVEGPDLVEQCLAIDSEPQSMLAGAAVPVIEDGEMIGIVRVGSLLNGDVEVVDRIRDAVFENETYNGKPVGTATIFMNDLRISTNVQHEGQRAVGTRVSQEVAEHVLDQGLSWTGRALVVDTWYLSQYDPIIDPDGNIIGMLYVGELEQKYLDLRTRAVVLYLGIILAGMALALVIFFLLTRGMLGSIYRLSEATKRFSIGDLGHRVEVRCNDEVCRLAASFNSMAEQLEQQHQELERRQLELETLNDELRKVNHNYMEMLGFVSHELKNPLTSAMMSLYTVKDGYLGKLNPAQENSLTSVAQSLDYFQDMIRDYLELSRLEKGELQVHKTVAPLAQRIVQPALESLERELQGQQIQVENHVPKDMVLDVDVNLLRIVYDNLLSNAVKYGRPGGALVLDAQENCDKVILSVCNEGEGIPPDKMALLFEKFSRLDSTEYAGRRGTGLGLYICREIMEKHGGEIWAESQRRNWTKFCFTIPKESET